MSEDFDEALRGKLPALTSQAQYNAFQASLDALCFTANAICAGDKDQEAAGRKAIEQSLGLLRQATEITNKLKDVPEAATSTAAEDFKKPPSVFGEKEVQEALLAELEKIPTAYQLGSWYSRTKDLREKVVSPSLRNQLYDAIRAKHMSFATSILEQWTGNT